MVSREVIQSATPCRLRLVVTCPDWHAAASHLVRIDSRFAPLVAAHGVPNWQPTRQPVQHLARAIVYQQLSGKAAGTIYKRFLTLFPRGRFPSARRLAATEVAKLRQAGLSQAKALAVKDLAAHVTSRRLRPAALHTLSNEEIAAALLPVRGIGPWSVDMFLMFALGRPDVLPVGDLGVKKGAQRHFRLRALPSAEALERLAEPWRPFRSVGSWYMWRHLDTP